MKNYLEFEKEIKALEQEVESLKSPFGSEGISEVDTQKIKNTQNEINEKGFDLELWNEFLEHPADFEALFSDVLTGKPKNFIAGYRSYYSSYALLADTKSYRDNLPSWRFPEGRKK